MTDLINNYFFLSTPMLLFCIGVYGIIFSNRNIIIIIMSIELLLLAVNLNFIFFSLMWWDVVGQVFALLVLTIAAAESAIGLAILVIYYRLEGLISIDKTQHIKG